MRPPLPSSDGSPLAARDPAHAFQHCEALVRDGDPDRFFATLFAPAVQGGAIPQAAE